MAVDFSGIKSLLIDGKPVKALRIAGKKVFPLNAVVTFSDNLEQYYVAGGSWGTIQSVPAVEVPVGGTVPADSVPQLTEASYTISSQTFTAYNTSDMWFKDSACTQKFNFGVDIIIEDITLYRKWGCESKTIRKSDAAGSLTFTLPKFASTISGYCIGGGGASGTNTGIRDDYCEIGIAGSGSNGTATSFSARSVTGGSSVTLYAGAGGSSSGAGGASYINIDGIRIITGNGGAAGTSSSRRFNIHDNDPEDHITGTYSSIGLYLATPSVTYTKIVDGYSRLGSVSFQYYGSGSSSAAYDESTISLRVMLDGVVKYDYPGKAGRYYATEDSRENWVEKYTKGSIAVNNQHLGTASTYGQGGFGGFAVSNGSSYNVNSQAGYRGQAYVTVE